MVAALSSLMSTHHLDGELHHVHILILLKEEISAVVLAVINLGWLLLF